jgi:hypothetical protein
VEHFGPIPAVRKLYSDESTIGHGELAPAAKTPASACHLNSFPLPKSLEITVLVEQVMAAEEEKKTLFLAVFQVGCPYPDQS